MKDIFFLDGAARFIDMTEHSFEQYCSSNSLIPRSNKIMEFTIEDNWQIQEIVLAGEGELEDSIIYDMFTSTEASKNLHVIFQSLEILDENQLNQVSKEVFTYIAQNTQ